MSAPPASQNTDLPQVAILFTHFAPYHIDRIEAAARRLAGRARVLAVEAADASDEYAWEPARAFIHAKHLVLFPGRVYEQVGRFERLQAYAETLRGAELVLTGIPYSEPDIVALAWRRRARGRRIVAMTDSKFDDKPRNLLREQVKARLLAGFSGAMVAGLRQRAYLEFLGFADKPLVPGYDTLSVERVRALAGDIKIAWAERPFVFVGRLVGKKNLPTLLAGYARYAEQAGGKARRLVLVGDGEQRAELEALAGQLGIAGTVDFAGLQVSRIVAQHLVQALALCLVSTEEQWGLVVNEAVALGIPAIVSPAVGARDALVRGGVTGHVVEPQSPESIARAMTVMAADEGQWQAMSQGVTQRAWLADAERFADATELLFDPENPDAARDIQRFWDACEAG
ncbi:glycosyltransferase [Qipengyuania marisflavi]|uniref:Glycosyltransferase n=1 Tax=Qipengyuania marisflavi TaxID=2486356 RepID=A0A5S3P6Z1_9SPHN|nr:glycosyltransferase [Qipengyuania marisflavi]TMM49001.1 glycosyltransferase [Qipengyuania marisflavi]